MEFHGTGGRPWKTTMASGGGEDPADDAGPRRDPLLRVGAFRRPRMVADKGSTSAVDDGTRFLIPAWR
jgi:hypothetical protein